MIGSWHGLVIDCKDPRTLASFYQELLGYTRVQDESDWVVIGKAPDQPGIAFQRIDNYLPPTWPKEQVPTQMHIDIRVESLESAAEEAISLGAILLSDSEKIFWVFNDPEGHPFCLVCF